VNSRRFNTQVRPTPVRPAPLTHADRSDSKTQMGGSPLSPKTLY